MKKLLLIFLLFFYFVSVTSADVTFYGDVTLYLDSGNIEVTFVDSGITLYYCEFQDSSNYILLENLNLTMTCTNSLAINISEVNNSINLTSGTTVLRFNATYTGSSVVFGFDGNHSNAFYDVYVNSVLKVDNSAVDSFSFTHSSWSKKDIDIRLAGYYPDPPYEGVSDYNTTDNTLNLSWSRGNYSDREVLVKKNGSYSSSPSDGNIKYNGTALYYDFTNFESGYYSVWSYNDTTNTFSRTGLNIPWGALGIRVFNESNFSQQITNFGLLISNQAGSSTYQNKSCTSSPHYLDLLDIPYGANTIIRINASNYKARNYYKNLVVNHFYNYTLYLPPVETPVDEGGGDAGGSGDNYSTTQNYVIQITNKANEPIPSASVVVTRYDDNLNSYVEIGSGITDGFGQFNIWAVPTILYKVNISATGYKNSNNNDWIPVYIEFADDRYKIFQLEYSEPDYENESNFNEEISFSIYVDPSSCQGLVNYTDRMGQTLNWSLYVYEINHTSGDYDTLFYSTSGTNNSFNYVLSVNCSNTYYAVLFLNHSTFGSQSISMIDNHPFVPGGTADDPAITEGSYINLLFNTNYGTSPLNMGWTNFIMFFIILLALFRFGQRNAGLSMLICGGVLLFVNYVIGFNNLQSSVIPVLFVLFGILVQWQNSKKEVGS